MTTEHFDDIDDLIKRVNDSADDNAEDLQHETKASEGNGNRDGKDNSNANNIDDSEIEGEEERLVANNKLTADDINFVFNIIKKEAEYDDISIKQLFYGIASAFTKRPIHHIVNSKEAGAGKNYLLELVSRYWPDKYITPLGNMSDKALFHRKGVLVITDPNTGKEQPIAPIITALNEEKEILADKIAEEKSKDSGSKDKDLIKEKTRRIIEIESEIKDIEANAEKLIDLNNQIFLFLDTPQSSLYDAIMSTVSQDTPKDQEYSFTDKTSSGKLITKNNKIRGTPVIIPTQVIDDSRTQRFHEKNRRFINVNPDTTSSKIAAAKNIMSLQGSYLPEEYDELVVSRSDKDRAKQIVAILVAKLKQHSKSLQPKECGVKIPFALSIAVSIPNNSVWAMTVNDRIIKYLSIIVKTRMDFRPRIVNTETGQFYPIATFEDLKDALYLMQVAASGIRPYLSKWYNERFVPAFEELDGKPNEDLSENGVLIVKEKHVGLTTEQLANKIKHLDGYKPSSKELLEKYLYPLCNQGILDSVKSEINGKYKIYFPVEEGNLYSIFDDSSSLKLKVPCPERFPDEIFLKESFRTLSRHYSNEGSVFEKTFSRYKLMDSDGTEITLDEMIDKYYNNSDECFVKGYPDMNEVDGSNDNSGTAHILTMAITTKNNVNYQHRIIQKNIFQNNPTLWNNVLTEFHDKVLEESYTGEPNLPTPFTTFSKEALDEWWQSEQKKIKPLDPSLFAFSGYRCYYCEDFETDNSKDSKRSYETHVKNKHGDDPDHPCYPSKADLERLGLKPQWKRWEVQENVDLQMSNNDKSKTREKTSGHLIELAKARTQLNIPLTLHHTLESFGFHVSNKVGPNTVSSSTDNNRVLYQKILPCYPFVKWAGGKRQIVPQLYTLAPPEFDSYFESFLGGGALFFHLISNKNKPFTAYISDINPELINVYVAVKDDVEKLIKLLTQHQIEYNKASEECCYKLRDNYNLKSCSDGIERAAQFITLNRTCFNGLYRVNKKGEFNAPIGDYKNPTICDAGNLRNVSAALRYSNITIKAADYKEILLENAKEGDFIYLDPPYSPESPTANFTSYTYNGFSNKDQEKLAEIYKQLDEMKCKVMLTNSNTPLVRELYTPFVITEVDSKRAINCKASNREGHTDLIIRNYTKV